MSCPVGGELRASVGAPALGLCGPSELSSLVRERMELSGALELKLPAAADAMAPGSDVAQVLREKIRSKCWSLLGAVSEHPRVGHPDVAERILSFLVEPEALVPSDQGGWMHPGTGSANLDLFFQTVPQSSPQVNHRLHELLAAAWGECPETCLRQVFMVGASREGKQDRYSFYDAVLWLWDRQPATVLANLHLVPEAIYWKGLLELAARICEGPRRSLERDRAMDEAFERGGGKLTPARPRYQGEGWKPGSRLELAREALRRYDSDPLYRVLFESVGRLFADQLREDLASMRAGGRIGLCAKWCPSLYHSFDRRTLICESIARWLFPASLPEFAGLSEREYAYRARDKLRGALGELREYAKFPERLMCQRRWSEIAYKAVPAACMKANAERFMEHDRRRFSKHLECLVSGKVAANTGALLPHEILADVSGGRTCRGQGRQRASRGAGGPVAAMLAQAQWEALVAKLRDEGVLDGCIPVCDVSGSMMQEAAPGVACMDVAVALSLLLAEVVEGPCARKLITFSTSPSIVELPPAGSRLAELDRCARDLDWGFTTNFYRVFDLVLQMDPPPRRIFVFSDMQFNDAGGKMTDLQRARLLYRGAGKRMPELVFWNLAAHSGAPATVSDEGVALVSGFSSVMMKTLLAEGMVETAPEETRKGPEDGPVPMGDKPAEASAQEAGDKEQADPRSGASGPASDDQESDREDGTARRGIPLPPSALQQAPLASPARTEPPAGGARPDEPMPGAEAEPSGAARRGEGDDGSPAKVRRLEAKEARAEAEAAQEGTPANRLRPQEAGNVAEAMDVEGGGPGTRSAERLPPEAAGGKAENQGSQASLTGLSVLARALDKPLLRRPRLVCCADEAMDLIHHPRQPASDSFQARPDCAGERAAAPEADRAPVQAAKSRWTTQSTYVGTLPCKEAVAAFLGRGIRGLRERLCDFLGGNLRACRRGVRVWVDVETRQELPPFLETGRVKVTAKARVGGRKLDAALDLLPDVAQEAIDDALRRAEQKGFELADPA